MYERPYMALSSVDFSSKGAPLVQRTLCLPFMFLVLFIELIYDISHLLLVSKKLTQTRSLQRKENNQ